MADARSLLRQQRAARRIDHPHANYSDSGKLTCTLCREPVKSEAQWEGHTRSVGHRQKLLAFQKSRQTQQQKQAQPPSHTGSTNGGATAPKSKSNDTLSDEALLAQIIGGGAAGMGTGQKRKHDEAGSDVEMDDAETEEAAVRNKRSKTTDRSSPTAPTTVAAATSNGNHDSGTDRDAGKGTPTIMPPSPVRRISGTPSHGVELQIPSRPATPSASGTSAGSTPRATSIGRSPLIPQAVQVGGLPVKQTQRAAFATTTASSTEPTTGGTMATTASAATADDEDDDWAAFEAEVVNATTTNPQASKGTNSGSAYASDAIISAAPLTADELAAKTEEEDHERRRTVADIELEDEKEEATRALETEFEEMEELEARVRRLKERREALRRGSIPAATATATAAAAAAEVTSSENGEAGGDKKEVTVEDEDEDDDDDDDDDDWAGFRFRG